MTTTSMASKSDGVLNILAKSSPTLLTTWYAEQVVKGNIVASHQVILACKRHLNDLKRAGTDEFPYIFKEDLEHNLYYLSKSIAVRLREISNNSYFNLELSYMNSNANGYPTAGGFDPDRPFAALPSATGGVSTIYYSDYYYQNTGQRIAMLGAYASVSC
jgi:hypothetical protein